MTDDQYEHVGDRRSWRRHARGPASGVELLTVAGERAALRGILARRTVVLCCCGPSLAAVEPAVLERRGVCVAACNQAAAIVRPHLWFMVDDPGRFVFEGWADPGVWKFVPAEHRDAPTRRWQGDELVAAESVAEMPGVFLYRRTERFDPATFLRGPAVCWGTRCRVTDALGDVGRRSVMLAALRILAYLGAGTVALVGADCRMDPVRPYAVEQSRSKPAIDANNALFEVLDRRIGALLPLLERAGTCLVNCTPASGLQSVPYEPLEEVLADARHDCCGPIRTDGYYE